WLCNGSGQYLLYDEMDRYLWENRLESLPYGNSGTIRNRKAEPRSAGFDEKNNSVWIVFTYEISQCVYTVDEVGQLIYAEPKNVTFDDITVNVSYEILSDGSHILFDKFRIVMEDYRGDVINLRGYLPNREAIRRFLECRLFDTRKGVEEEIRKAEEKISKALSMWKIKDDQNVLLNLFRFKKYKAVVGSNWEFANDARFNLLIRMNHKERLRQCLQTVVRDLSISNPDDKIKVCPEINLLRWVDVDSEGRPVTEKFDELISDMFKDAELVIIIDCKEENAWAKTQEQIARETVIYEATWECIVKAAKQPDAASLIIVADDTVYRKTFRKNSEIYERLCRHHLEIPDLSVDEVYQMSLDYAKRQGFALSEETEERFHKWLLEEYPRSEVKEWEFVDELFNNQIFTDFLTQGRESMTLMPDIIPTGEKLRAPEEIFQELDRLVGLEQVKKELRGMYNTRVVLGTAYREPEHMCFVGNPGTGKTEVAKMVVDLLYAMRLISKDVCVTVKATDLMAGYLGQTSGQTEEYIKKAYGGVLFIDEAYGLGREESLYAQEALDVLIQEMADTENPERPVVILAGYEEEMHQLMAANPGLQSRIRRFVHFKDYSEDELFRILYKILEEKGFQLDASEKDRKRFRDKDFKLASLPKQLSGLSDLIKEKKSKEFFGNARDMRTLCDRLIEQWACDGSDESPAEKPRVIGATHIDSLNDEKRKEETEGGIGELIGMADLKEKLAEFEAKVKYGAELRRNGIVLPTANMHMLFVGNPGTGKTTVAMRLADKLCRIGVLPSNRCIVAEGKDLIRYQKEKTPAQTTEDYIKRARGGILFIDEAYSLLNRQEGWEVIDVLLTAMEKYKEDTIFIFAGYPRDMEALLNANSGLQSRIANHFEFPDYEPAELVEILYLELRKTGLHFADDDAAIAKLLDIMEMFSAMPNFGNGRFVGLLFEQIIAKRANAGNYKKGDKENLRTLTTDDIPTISELLRTSHGRKGLEDPEKRKDEIMDRVARHELGHAVVSLETDGDTPIEKISVKGSYGSYGRVSYRSDGNGLATEQELRNRLATLLGGRNAERVFFGDSSVGCSSDYESAKNLAKWMIESWAMGELGISNEMDFMREADARATKILYDNREFIDAVAAKLVEKREISG
ncbi:MAG: AAA family ATPase, partial [Lachnospiraceae bacterium]|nr:AAA family ATPase [Lachnospiraceae bacterium]